MALNHDSERILRAVLEALPVGVWIQDRNGTIVHGNRAGIQIWGGARYVGPEHFGEYKGWWLSSGRRIAPDEWAGARAIRNGETSIGEEIEIECFDGTRKIIRNSAIPLFDGEGRPEGSIIVNEDITHAKRDEAALRRAKENLERISRELTDALARERLLGRTDDVTGATTRRHFFALAAQEISVARRYSLPISVIVIDVDEFKQVNDTYGHLAGDEALRHIAEVCRGPLRQADVFARYGGDEFIVLLPHTTAHEAAKVCERMRHNVEAQPIAIVQGRVAVTVTAGIAELAADDTLDTLIHRADIALFEAKRRGRNQTLVSAPVV